MPKVPSLLMTRDQIRAEFGFPDPLIRFLLPKADTFTRLNDRYLEGQYKRERLLEAIKTPEARSAIAQWDEILCCPLPSAGWTARMGDIGHRLAISAVAVGKLLSLIGYRSGFKVTQKGVAAGCGILRWDGFCLHSDWNIHQTACAIRAAAEDPRQSQVAGTLEAAVARQQGRKKRRVRQQELEQLRETARQERQSALAVLIPQLTALRMADPGIDLLTGVEFITPDPVARILLYQESVTFSRSVIPNDPNQNHAAQREITKAEAAAEIGLLIRRARFEGFDV